MLTILLRIRRLLINIILTGGPSEVGSCGCPEILIPNLLILCLKIDTMSSRLTDVGGDPSLKTHCLRNVRTCHENVLTPLGEVLGNEVEVVEKAKFHGIVGLI